MAKFFLAATNLSGGRAIIRGEDAEHIKVLRMRPGEEVILSDGEGTDYVGRFVRVENGESEVEILEQRPSVAEPTVRAAVLAGLPKGERADFLVQKCVELGASEILFFSCARCVAKANNMEKKLERWQRIAREAAMQSGRGAIPKVGYLEDFGAALNEAVKRDLKLFLYETGERVTMKQAVQAQPEAKTAALLTGPEGGFEPYEAELARQLGLDICALGPRILRCETAPMAALTALMYATDNL